MMGVGLGGGGGFQPEGLFWTTGVGFAGFGGTKGRDWRFGGSESEAREALKRRVRVKVKYENVYGR